MLSGRHASTIDDALEGDVEENAVESTKHKGKARMSDIGHVSGTSSPERASPHSDHVTLPVSAQHHYPPSPAFEGSSGDRSPTIVHAARALKHAVLHDARNLRHANSDTETLSWNIASAREAKVWTYSMVYFDSDFSMTSALLVLSILV